MKSKEANRRKDYCLECKNFKPIKAKKMCQNCWHKYKRKYNKKFYLSTKFTEMKMRCENPNNKGYKNYKNKLKCTRKEFINFFIKDKQFNKLFKTWQINDFDIKLSPSIDRIDNLGNYELSNMQMLTHQQNCSKDQKRIKVLVTKDEKFIGVYESLLSACNSLGLLQPNAWKVLHGERKRVKGYKIQYAE